MDKKEVTVLVNTIVGMQFEMDGITCTIDKCTEDMRDCPNNQIFLVFESTISGEDILVAKLMDQDLIEDLINKMRLYRLGKAMYFFVYPGIEVTPTDVANKFNCRICIQKADSQEDLTEEFTTLEIPEDVEETLLKEYERNKKKK